MEEPHEEQQYARKFLLGYLNEAEQRIVEDRFITDPDYLELVLGVESELMEDYIAGEFSEDERKRFEKHILTNQLQIDQLNLTRGLRAAARVHASANSPPVPAETTPIAPQRRRRASQLWAVILEVNLSAAIILVMACGTTLFVVWRIHTSNPQPSLAEELKRLNAQQSLSANTRYQGFIIGPLKGGLVRDEQEVKAFTIPKTEELVQLRLQIGAGAYQSFQAALQTAENQELFSLTDLKAITIGGERVVVIYVPAKILAPEDYQLRLNGLTQNNETVYLGRYNFRIVGK